MIGHHYQDWKYGYGKPQGQAYDQEEARHRFKAGTTMTALVGVGAPSAPETVVRVELGGDMVVVTWLDQPQRPTLKYLWNKEARDDGVTGDWLHLQQVSIVSYEHDLHLPEGCSTYNQASYLNTDGSYTAYRGRRGVARPASAATATLPTRSRGCPRPSSVSGSPSSTPISDPARLGGGRSPLRA